MYSFDIFDTLITRTVASPDGIFMLMQNALKGMEGYDEFLVANFYELRLGAEKLARIVARRNERREVSIQEIYRALATTARVTKEQLRQLEELEITTECNNARGLVAHVDMVKKYMEEGERVVLISDMYLGEKNIRRILSTVDPIFCDIPIYVSSDYGETKSGMGLYHIVKRTEKVEFSEWTHYGDNLKSDINVACELGIDAIYLPSSGMKEYECPLKDLYHMLSVGSSKYVRTIGRDDAVNEVGHSLGGPILYAYVNWVLKTCLEAGINRLYFVARDGWILQQIADVIIQARNYSIATHYIYGSRKVWRLPAFDGSEEALNNILAVSNMNEVISLDDIASLFQLDINELKRFLPKELYEYEEKEMFLYIYRQNICAHLKRNKEFCELLYNSQEKKRELVLRYLQQELDTSDDKFAFVELSGTGLTQRQLARLMRTFYSGTVYSFYLKLEALAEENDGKLISFYPNYIDRGFMVELLCRAPHGQTEAYEERDGRIVPVLNDIEGEQIKAYHIETYRDAVLEYVRQMEGALSQNGINDMGRVDIVKEYMNVIALYPPKRVADYFAHMPFCAGGRNKTVEEFAPAPSKKQLRDIYFWHDGTNVRQVYQGSSIDYALVVNENMVKYKEKCQKYRENIVGKRMIGIRLRWNGNDGYKEKYYCPWQFLKGSVVIYGAGQVGQAYVRQAMRRKSYTNNLLWVDRNYVSIKKIGGVDVKSPELLADASFDRVIIAIHNNKVSQSVYEYMLGLGVDGQKIYFG